MGWANNGWGTGGGEGDPIVANMYQPMVGGNDTDALTTGIADTGDYPPTGTTLQWVVTDNLFVSTDIDMTLPGPVSINGNNVTESNPQGWRWLNEFERNFITLQIKIATSTQSYSQLVIGCYLYLGHEAPVFNQHDLVSINTFGGYSSVLQAVTISGQLSMRAPSSVSFVSTFSDPIAVDADKLYWVNLLCDNTGGAATVSVFDPENNFNEITDSPVTAAMDTGSTGFQYNFGRIDAHGDNPGDSKSSYIGQIVMGLDSDEPIIPSIGSGGKGWANSGWGN